MPNQALPVMLWFFAGAALLALAADLQILSFQPVPFLQGPALPLIALGLTGLWLARRRDRRRQSGQPLGANPQGEQPLFRCLPIMLHSIDRRGRITEVSDFWLEKLGYRREEVIGKKIQAFLARKGETFGSARDLSLFFKEGRIKDIPFRLLDKNGDEVDVLLSAIPEKGGRGKARRSLAVTIDLRPHLKAEKEIKKLAYFDTLTGLPNRTLFQDRLNQAVAQAQREGLQVGVIFLDLDQFKNVNDTLGHAIGDSLLKTVAERLKRCVREEDTVARLGGDEFVILLPHLQHDRSAATLAERILEVLAQPIKLAERELFSPASMGIALFPADAGDIDTLLRNADIAMYAAKESGRNTFRFFSAEMNAKALEKLRLEMDLRRALEKNEFFLTYQPQLDLATGQITGVEALLRWQHPERGLVPPARFIPLAEETGMILAIGEWVLRTACRQARSWHQAGLWPLRISVNVSGRQFRQQDFVEMVEMVLQETGLDPRSLELELTESVVMEDVQSAIMTLTDLKVRNINLAIDDFGTGYSSLIYLKHFPIDRIKIAQEFVRDIPSDPDDAAIVQAIIAMAHSLNLAVIAEGVEKREQLEMLRTNRCSEMQGYYFARPMAVADVAKAFSKGGLGNHCCLYRS